MDSTTLPQHPGSRISQYIALTKPRVTQLAVFCAVIGMFLSTPGMVPWKALIGGTVGIWLTAGAAFAINCLVEQKIDAMMRRTAWRPSARGEITSTQILLFSAVLGGLGMWTLYTFTNPLTMWLTFATFVGYADEIPAAGGTSYTNRPRTIARFGYAAVAKALPYPFAPMYVVMTGDSTVAPDRVARLTVPPLDEGPHMSYAIQWFGFALVALVGAGYVVKQAIAEQRSDVDVDARHSA